MPLTIRRATVTDAEGLSALSTRLFIETFIEDLKVPYPAQDLDVYLGSVNSTEAMARRLSDAALAVWLAEDQTTPAAYAIAGPADFPHPESRSGDGALHRLYVDRRQQGQGLAGAMMTLALDWLDARYSARPWLGVCAENLRAQRFYARFGFEIVGEYKYPVGTWLDDEFIMRRR